MMHTDEASPIISWRQHVWTLPAPALLRNWDRSLECWLIANKRHSSQTNCKLFGAKFADVCANRRWQLSNLIMFLSYSDIKHAFLSAAGDATHHRYFLFFFFFVSPSSRLPIVNTTSRLQADTAEVRVPSKAHKSTTISIRDPIPG